VITETIFAWPGLGRLFYDSLSSRDYPVLMAMMEMSAVTIGSAIFWPTSSMGSSIPAFDIS